MHFGRFQSVWKIVRAFNVIVGTLFYSPFARFLCAVFLFIIHNQHVIFSLTAIFSILCVFALDFFRFLEIFFITILLN